VSILLLSLGGGGGNILRSLKALFRQDLAVAQESDARFAGRLGRAVTTRFLDTNAFSLSDVPQDERVLIGSQTTGRLGARHNPDVARQALEESRDEVEALIAAHSVVVVVGTGGKGTGAGTMFPVAQMARQQQKLVIPIFVRPSFERHEVDKRRFDHALGVVGQFDGAAIRLIEILNDEGYVDSSPEAQAVVWERMNRPIARGLRGLIYVLSDLSQVDPSDLSMLFAGPGRLRIGFSEIDPAPSHEPSDQQVEDAVRECWHNTYYAFRKPVGTSLVCIQGDWSNVADGRIKGGLARLAAAGDVREHLYTPLYARAPRAPKPWGITALFAEYTGNHQPLAIDWQLDRRLPSLVSAGDSRPRAVEVREAATVRAAVPAAPAAVDMPPLETPPLEAPRTPFGNLWEFALAVNRGNPAALALAGGPPDDHQFPVEGGEVRKLLGTVWFRTVVPALSESWREYILQALVTSVRIPDHAVKIDRRDVRLSALSHDQFKDLVTRAHVTDTARPDVDLLLAVVRLWGAQALARFAFSGSADNGTRSRFATAMLGFRK